MQVLATLALAAGVAFASIHGNAPAGVSRRHHELANRSPVLGPEPQPLFEEVETVENNGTHVLAKRAFTNARASWYDVGLGACGKHNVPGDFIVALNTPQYGGGYPGPNCFRKINISYKGITTTATVMDQCPGCPYGGLDFSKGLFTHFSSLGTGIIYVTWTWAGEDNSPPPKPTPKPTPKPSPKPTSTWTPKPKPTSTWTPKPSSSTHKPTSTRTRGTSTSTSTTTTTTTTTTTSTPTPTGPQNVVVLEQAVLGLAEMLNAAVAVDAQVQV